MTASPSSPRGFAAWREVSWGDLLRALWTVVRAVPRDLRRLVGQVATAGKARLVGNPPLWLLALLRSLRPTFTSGRLTLVTRRLQVLDVLNDDERYSVAPYGVPMLEISGPFALGLDGAEHRVARAHLDEAVLPIDTGRLASFADQVAQRLVEEARGDGRMDLVGELAEPVATGFVTSFLGVPDPSTPDRPGLTVWSTQIFEACFLNLVGDRGVHRRGLLAADALRAHLGPLVHAAMAPDAKETDTVLARLAVERRGDPDPVISDLIGLVVASIPTTAEAAVRVLDYLIDHPDRAREVRTAVTAGDRHLVWQHALEVLRFNPQSPGLLRQPVCPAERVEAEPRIVLASTLSAAHDRRAVEQPGRYRVDRTGPPSLVFGAGPHRCLGEPYAREMVTSMVMVMLREPSLVRWPGPPGRPAAGLPMPDRLVVRLS